MQYDNLQPGADVTYGYRNPANGVFWLGKDGNVYVAGDKGVNSAGAWDDATGNYWKSRGFELVDDPVNPSWGGEAAPSAPGDPNGSGSGTTDRSASIALQLAGLGASESKLNTGLAKIDEALGSLTGQYDTETASNEKIYGTSVDQNQNNLQSNKQSALVNAVQGRRGLFSTLASIGALNGTGIDLANRAVQAGANEDLTGAQDTFNTNKTSLDTSIEGYRLEDKRRRQEAATSAENARTNTRNDVLREKQGFYTNLANDFNTQGDKGQGNYYAQLAASLYPSLATTSVPNANIGYSGAMFTAPQLESYLAGGNTAVRATSGNGMTIPGLIGSTLTGNKKKQPLAV